MAEGNKFGLPPTSGHGFTSTLHAKAEGPTDPANNKTKNPFVVCVTGAGKGLGFHISLAYAKAKVSGLVISSRTQSDLDLLTKEIRNVNKEVEILAQLCDTMKDDDVKKLVQATKDKFGRLDVCIANAGVISKYLEDGSLPKGILTDWDFERVIDINLLGTVRVARSFTPLLLETDGGAKTFIVITSIAAHFMHSGLTPIAYNTSKQAVCNLVEMMENDHGEDGLISKDGLISYAIHPGAVLTPQTEHHSMEKGDIWEQALKDDIALCGGFLTWLTKERRPWLSGRYLAVTLDVDELEKKKGEIVEKDLLKFKMTV